ncbi:MAG: 30S ribosomal protein S16 [Elusimicrobiota bacterium]
MAVKIRLKRTGRKKDPHYKVVAVDSRKKRDGRVIEYIGHYHPRESFDFSVDMDRYEEFKTKGALVSDTVRTLVNKLKRGPKKTVAAEEESPEEKAPEAESLKETPQETEKEEAEPEEVKSESGDEKLSEDKEEEKGDKKEN